MYNAVAKMRIKTQIVDAATGAIVKDNPERENLIFDYGLTSFAGGNALSASAASSFTRCRIGSGTQPTSINSGAITLTSVGTALTASSGFFTARMVGALIKMDASGSAGQEFYIASVTSGTLATAATAPSPDVAAEFFTVWFVQELALETLLYSSSTYQTNSGDCQSTVTGGTITHKRTFTFPVQAGSYNVNEIGYDTGSGNLTGRIVLPSTDTVAPTNFYVVIMSLSLAYTPRVPTAVASVGTNIDTAGNAIIEFFNVAYVNSAGATTRNGTYALLEPAEMINTITLCFATATYSQPASTPDAIANSPSPYTTQKIEFTGLPVKTNPSIGVAVLTWSSVSLTTSGQTLYGFGLTDNGSNRVPFDIKFTATVTAPTGTMQLTGITFQIRFSRVLVN